MAKKILQLIVIITWLSPCSVQMCLQLKFVKFTSALISFSCMTAPLSRGLANNFSHRVKHETEDSRQNTFLLWKDLTSESNTSFIDPDNRVGLLSPVSVWDYILISTYNKSHMSNFFHLSMLYQSIHWKGQRENCMYFNPDNLSCPFCSPPGWRTGPRIWRWVHL